MSKSALRGLRRTALLTAALIVPGGEAQAQPKAPPGPTAPGVEEVVAMALDRSPALAARRARVAAARELEKPAAVFFDPMLEAMLQNAGAIEYTVGKEEMSMIGVEARQGLLYPGKRRAAGEVARAETALREAELAALERQVAAEIRRTYARLYALDRERQALQAARELVEMLSATAAVRYSAGEVDQEALIKAQLEVLCLGELLDDLAAKRAAMVAEINRWLDRPGDAPLDSVATLPPVAVEPQPWAASAIAGSAEIAVGRAAVEVGARRVRAAELELRPNLSAAAGLGSRGGMDPIVTLRFGLELPFWQRQKQEPMVRATRQELTMAEQELRDAEAMVRAEAARIAAEWETAERQIVRYRDAIVPRTSVAFDAARASYLAGRGDFSTVIEDFELWLEARVQLSRREADRFAAWADLRRLTDAAVANPAQEAPEGEPQ